MIRRPTRRPDTLRVAVLAWACACASAAAPVPAAQPGLMQAAAVNDAPADAPPGDIAGYWISEKLDGVRGRWDGRRLWTRAGHAIDPPDWFTAGWPQKAMDGELWLGRGRFDEVAALLRRSSNDDAWRAVRFLVFDLPGHGGPFAARVEAMRTLPGAGAPPWLRAVAQSQVADAAGLQARLAAVLAAGGEGLMLHHGAALYTAGRSEGLRKLKPHDDAEARVLAHLPGNGKYAGMLGALLVERADGARFRLGSGLSDAERATPPPVGSLVTYRYNGYTGNGLPRFARFLRIRTPAEAPGQR
ncbi:DNA ligase [Luteimonas sp. MC1825]|uniref:DNA ligase n=1 Tax=Luteimonas sp. MC1825 TaxID=2761107 RepID=UPI001621810A|nr:DNA ligase [Luteimonas sp. MC1825]MBB6599405.1 DNA ligase [Luteimonas sp. MC1825]QOC87114.1 DNA ligase [Luteimonas sp. MC1825]